MKPMIVILAGIAVFVASSVSLTVGAAGLCGVVGYAAGREVSFRRWRATGRLA
ncbi:MAG: hypothetical protein NTW86_01325 [Candidatus Sumerlaeota bacterium]|nr:hypothetical protein [Candidatus Sumerlaeota bacterium]